MDVHARESGSPMRSNSVAPTYESRTGDSLRTAEAGVRSFLSLLWLAIAVAATGTACKKQDDCAKAIDHAAHLSYLDTQKSLPQVSPEIRAGIAEIMPSEEEMLPNLRESTSERFGARCQTPAFAKCVLAAEDASAVARCENTE
jgi:hypothetical protein